MDYNRSVTSEWNFCISLFCDCDQDCDQAIQSVVYPLKVTRTVTLSSHPQMQIVTPPPPPDFTPFPSRFPKHDKRPTATNWNSVTLVQNKAFATNAAIRAQQILTFSVQTQKGIRHALVNVWKWKQYIMKAQAKKRKNCKKLANELSQVCSQVADKSSLHCLSQVVGTSLEHAVYNL